MQFSEFASLCYELEKMPSRLAKIAAASEYLKRLKPEEIRFGVAFLSGRPFPVSDPRTLDVGAAALYEASSDATGGESSAPGVLENAPELLRGSTFQVSAPISESPQPTETSSNFEPLNREQRAHARALTIPDVAGLFGAIAEASGKGSRREKSERLRDLIGRTTEFERPILFRLLHNELRIGLHDGLIQEAIARAAETDLKTVRRAALFLSDLAEVASIALTEGPDGLERVDVKVFVPLLPMLSELSEDFEEVLAAHNGVTALEYKYDGARIQIHKQGDRVRVWSRRLSEVTDSIPEIVGIARTEIEGDSFILDGEVVAVGGDGRPYPFQELMRRFKRVHGIESAASDIPLGLYLFDCLFWNGTSLIDEPYKQRWSKLGAITSTRHLARRQITSDAEAANAFLEQARTAGHEGLMAKALTSPYMPGNRGKLWFKIKPAETVDCVILAADRGSGRRRGWLSNYHLAVADGQGGFAPVGKTFKGLTDKEFAAMTERLRKLETGDNGYTVTVKPEIVVEVAYNEIQSSPQYSSRFALRFARIAAIREDKSADQITTLAELQTLYERQFVTKSRRD